MTGSLPSCLATLQQLWYLDVDGNDFMGSLPAFPASSMLQMVYASSNELTGTIPASIWSIPTLVDLELSNNLLSGQLPSVMPCWKTLSVLTVDNNQLTGSVPSTMNTASSIVYLDLSFNKIRGSLPTFDHLSGLLYLYVSSNVFTGSVPSAWGNLVRMAQLDFSLQFVTGTLPSTLGNLRDLTVLWGNSNFISGSIPATLASCTGLYELLLYQNLMSGSISDALVNLENLSSLLLFINAFSGSLPEAMGNMTALNDVELYTNAFTGTIPTSLASVQSLQTLLLDDNYFSVDLAAMFATTTTTPPTTTTTGNQQSPFMALQTLSISFSHLHADWAQAMLPSSLMYLDLESSSLTGTLPERWLNDTSLVLLGLSTNALTGTLPPRLLQTTVAQLFVDDNAFHGSFPAMDASVAACTMQNVHVAGNYLSGSLSPSLSQCHQLSTFVASEMHLSGPIDAVFADPRQLRELVVNNNYLTGRVTSVFANSTATGLILNAAYNQFTGPLPVQSLAAGQYQALILTENCMTGSLPSDLLCANRNLTELLLSGLHAASTCRSTVVASGDGATIGGWSVYSSYVESEAVYGSLPSCVLYLPQLTFLALSGNRLTGTIATDAGGESRLSENLEGIDLSHNQLSGPIPSLLLTTPSQFIDLSFNRFSGTLPRDAVYPVERVDPSWSLQVNMLSGTLPAAWETFPRINVLEGNLFACAAGTVATTAHLPTHDPFATTYTCGSSATDVSLLVAVVGGVVFLGLVVAWEWWSPARTADGRSVTSSGGGGEGGGEEDGSAADAGGRRGPSWQRRLHRAYVWGRSEAQFVWYVVRDYRGLLVGVVAMLAASMLVYVGTSLASSAYAYLYVWVIALALQQGAAAAMVLLAWLTAFVLWLRRECNGLIARRRRMKREKAAAEATEATEATEWDERGDTAGGDRPSAASASWWRSWLYPAAVVSAVTLALTVPSFVVNIVYVYTTTLNHVSRVWRLGIVWAMACFKLGWNSAMTWAVMRWDYFGVAQANASRKRWLSLFATIGVFNVIVSPLLTEVLVSPNCFQYVFTRIPVDSYTVTGGFCFWISYVYVDPVTLQATPLSAFPCMSYDNLLATYDSGSASGGNIDLAVLSFFNNGLQSSIDFQAGFAYNNQCAFSILQAFVHVFVYRYVLSIVVLPLWVLCVKRWQRRRVQALVTSSATSTAVAASSTLRWLRWSMRCVPMQFRVVDWDVAAVAICNVDEARVREVLQLNEDALSEWTRDDGRRIGMCVDLLWLRMVSDMGILLSFGVLFPPLGLLVLLGGGLELWWMQAFIVRLRGHVRAVQAVGEREAATVRTVSNPLAPATTAATAAVAADRDGSDAADEAKASWLRRYQTLVLTTMGRLEAALVDTMPRVVGEVFVVLCFAALLWGLAVFDVLGRSARAGDRSAVWVFAVVVTMPQWTTLLARGSQTLWEARWWSGTGSTATTAATATSTVTSASSKRQTTAEGNEALAKDVEMAAMGETS